MSTLPIIETDAVRWLCTSCGEERTTECGAEDCTPKPLTVAQAITECPCADCTGRQDG